MQRSAGILLPISSLPSPYGIGCFSQEAYDFVDWLKEAGQTYWQILPLGVTSYGDSPYQSFSAFAGNPYFISLDALVEEGVMTAAECKKANFGRKADDINYSRLYTERGRLLRLAYSRSDIGHNEAFAAFCEKNKWWLDDFALFMAVKDRFEGKPWIEWAEDIRLRWQPAMDYYRRELYFEVEYHKYLQFKFDEQWRRLKAYANSKGIRIIGDIPIYVALDSADAWANPGLFQLDKENLPTAVAGVPPDGFSPTGQLWGNPLYRWEAHRATGYQWWITRLWYCFELYDVVRIDHFRGFDEYFSIPYGSETAVEGHWEKGPGIELFRANDDGEPSSTAGKPILGQITKAELTDILIVVIRYFGGVKLGTSGLIVAYREAAIDALAHCEEVTQQVEEIVTYDFTYPMMNDVMRIVKEMNPRIVDQTFDNTCSIKLSIRKSEAEQLRTRLKKLSFE